MTGRRRENVLAIKRVGKVNWKKLKESQRSIGQHWTFRLLVDNLQIFVKSIFASKFRFSLGRKNFRQQLETHLRKSWRNFVLNAKNVHFEKTAFLSQHVSAEKRVSTVFNKHCLRKKWSYHRTRAQDRFDCQTLTLDLGKNSVLEAMGSMFYGTIIGYDIDFIENKVSKIIVLEI